MRININNISFFCINLDRRQDRWNSMQQEFDKYKLDIKRWPAIDAKKIDISPKVLAASISHISLLEFAYAKNYEYLMVFEDDIILAKNFKTKLIQYVSEIPKDWEVFSLHCYKSKTKNISHHACKLESMMFGAHGILVKGNAIPKILNNTKIRIDCPEEIYFKNINIYAPKARFTLAFQNGVDSDLPETSVIEEYREFNRRYLKIDHQNKNLKSDH